MPGFVTSDHIRIHYEIHGSNGPPLILLHGLGSATLLWTPQLPALKRHFQVYSFDYPGHGHSQWIRHYSIRDLARILKEFMDHHGLEQAHLMGLSLGCAVALTFACHYPQRVLSLVLEGPVGGLKPVSDPSAWLKILLLKTYMLFLLSLWHLFGKEKAIGWVNRYGFQTYGRYPFLEKMQHNVDPLAIWQLALDIAHPPYNGYLNRVTAPAMIIIGKGDITPRRYYTYIKNNLCADCALMVVPGARHIVGIENPEEFNRLTMEFLGCFLPREQNLREIHRPSRAESA